ncbi:MAG: preprotein translocase subunit YajC [Planctomycetaceae bacterium]
MAMWAWGVWQVLAQAGGAAAPPGGSAAPGGAGGEPGPGGLGDFVTLVPMLVIFAIFYLLMLRPQQQEQRRQQLEVAALKKDDEVVTVGGLIGTVANFSDDGREVTLKIADNTRVRVLRESIRGLLKRS